MFPYSTDDSHQFCFGDDDQSILIEPAVFRTNYYSKEKICMVSPQTVFTYPFHQITMQSYKS